MTDLTGVVLSAGEHAAAGPLMSLMELMSYLNGEPHTNEPKCLCPVLGYFVRGMNHGLSDVDRQRLLPYADLLANNYGTIETQQARAQYLAKWAAGVPAINAVSETELTGLTNALIAADVNDLVTKDTMETAAKAIAGAPADAVKKQDPAFVEPAPYGDTDADFQKAKAANRGAAYVAADASAAAFGAVEKGAYAGAAEAAVLAGLAAMAMGAVGAVDHMFSALDFALTIDAPEGNTFDKDWAKVDIAASLGMTK